MIDLAVWSVTLLYGGGNQIIKSHTYKKYLYVCTLCALIYCRKRGVMFVKQYRFKIWGVGPISMKMGHFGSLIWNLSTVMALCVCVQVKSVLMLRSQLFVLKASSNYLRLFPVSSCCHSFRNWCTCFKLLYNLTPLHFSIINYRRAIYLL